MLKHTSLTPLTCVCFPLQDSHGDSKTGGHRDRERSPGRRRERERDADRHRERDGYRERDREAHHKHRERGRHDRSRSRSPRKSRDKERRHRWGEPTCALIAMFISLLWNKRCKLKPLVCIYFTTNSPESLKLAIMLTKVIEWWISPQNSGVIIVLLVLLVIVLLPNY